VKRTTKVIITAKATIFGKELVDRDETEVIKAETKTKLFKPGTEMFVRPPVVIQKQRCFRTKATL
jgi:hypothetical protein